MLLFYISLGIILYLIISHYISYQYLKKKILKSRKWDLNICCGKTDGGGVNADIQKHKDVPNFKLVKNIYRLPFKDKQFKNVLCSHTIEHVDDPKKFFKELKRVGKSVTIVIPPLYDLGAVLNVLEHKWVFLTFRKKHSKLPKHVKLLLSDFIQNKLGQRNHA